MKMIQLSLVRRTFLDFAVMSLAGMAFQGLRKLHELGQSLTGIVVDSLGVAAVYALLVYVSRNKDEIEKIIGKS